MRNHKRRGITNTIVILDSYAKFIIHEWFQVMNVTDTVSQSLTKMSAIIKM